jgi:hypothetical protein
MSFSSFSKFSVKNNNNTSAPPAIPSGLLGRSKNKSNKTKKAKGNNSLGGYNPLPALPPWSSYFPPSVPITQPQQPAQPQPQLPAQPQLPVPAQPAQFVSGVSALGAYPKSVSKKPAAAPITIHACKPPGTAKSGACGGASGPPCPPVQQPSLGQSSKKGSIKHEKQHSLYCGQHALNNLLQGRMMFISDYANRHLEIINGNVNISYYCNKVHGVVSGAVKISDMCDPKSGYYDASVLITALRENGYDTAYHVQRKKDAYVEFTDPNLIGFIINEGNHYYAIIKQLPSDIDNVYSVNGNPGLFIKVNSTDSSPKPLNEKEVKKIIKSARGIIAVKLP